MRYPLNAVTLAMAITWGRAALAQHCHVPPPSEPGQLGVSVDVSSEFATYQNSRYEGEYQGLTLSGAWEQRWARLKASLPAYRLTRNGPATHGLGDVFAEVRVPFARNEDDTRVSGLALAATLPTGDAARDLGMGHVMLMPALWTTWSGQQAFVSAQVGYGRALASLATAHHGGASTGAIVNPMNPSEVELALAGGVNVSEQLRFRGGAYGAVPVAVPEGEARAAFFAGVDLVIESWFHVGTEGHLPLAGDPFLAKIVVAAGTRF